MTAKAWVMTVVVGLVLAVSVSAPVVAQEAGQPTPTSEQSSAIEDGQIVGCGEISENGRYEVASDFEHDGSEVCLNVTANSVTIHGGIMGGDRDTSTAIQANADTDGEIRITDMTFRYWGERVLDSEWGGQKFTVENTKFLRNTHVYQGTEGGGLEMSDSEVSNTHSAAIWGERMGTIRIHDSTFTGGGSSAVSTIDGAAVRITSSEFKHHDGTPLGFGHTTNAEVHNTEITHNEGNGIDIVGTAHDASLELHDSTIRRNDGHGVNAQPLRSEYSSVVIENTEIDDNGELAINGHHERDSEGAEVISGRDVDLGGGLVVSFENQVLDLSTEAAHDHETDALVFSGPGDADVTADFTTGSDDSKLWAQMSDGWQERGSYDSGSFTEVIGPGTWAASAGSQQTDPPEQTDTPTPRSGADDSSSTPSGPVSGAVEPSGDTPEPQESTDPMESSDGESRTTQTPVQVSEPQTTPTDAGSTPDSERSAAEDDPTEREPTDTERDSGDNATTQETEGDDGVAMDGPGLGVLPALIAVLGGSLLIRRRL